jgi:hypothetical protein
LTLWILRGPYTINHVAQHDWQCMVLIDLIVNGQTYVAQNNFAQHDWSCMGRVTDGW